MITVLRIALVCSLFSSLASAQTLDGVVSGELPELIRTYKGIHARPELSHQEKQTAALFAAGLRTAGYSVTERVGKYPDGTQAYGVVAILENGPGPRLLIRTDMDALPVTEETNLEYASHVKAAIAAGRTVGVMHACGHDIHVTTLLGTAQVLAALRKQWHGTLMLVGQPSEETVDGAKAMLADHLYDRFGQPDFAIALHDTHTLAAGMAAVGSGPVLAGLTSVDVTLRGIGGHGAAPQSTKDPIVMAGEFIVQLQTIVSRQENPLDPSVLTIGTIHGGTKRNIIPDEVTLELTARTFSDVSKQVILDGIQRTADAVALAAGVPDGRRPIVTVVDNESTPATYNDPALNSRVKLSLIKALGADNVTAMDQAMGSEDFGVFGLAGHKIPTVMFFLGVMDAAKLAAARSAGKSLPGLHSNLFAPEPEPTLRAGVTAMTSVALDLLQR